MTDNSFGMMIADIKGGNMEKFVEKLVRMHACKPAIEWLEKEGFKTLDDAWQVCEDGSWMLWLEGNLSGKPGSEKRKKLVLASCECGRLSLPYAGSSKDLIQNTYETAEKWAKGEGGVTLDDVRAAAYASNAAASNAAAYDAANAAYAAAYAADAADANANTAAANAYAAAKQEILKQCADIVRKYYPVAPEFLP